MARAGEADFRTADGTRLRLTLHRSGRPAVVLVVPGIFAHRGLPEHARVREALAARFDVATLDVRGHGDSEGAFTFGDREPGDVAAVAAWLRRDHDRVGGLGFSFGGFHVAVAAAAYAEAHPFDAAALVSAPARLSVLDGLRGGALLRSMPYMLRRRRRPTRLVPGPLARRPEPWRVIAKAGELPLLVVHGADDWLIPLAHARLLHKHAAGPCELLEIEGGLHAEYMAEQCPERLLPPLVQFFSRWLG